MQAEIYRAVLYIVAVTSQYSIISLSFLVHFSGILVLFFLTFLQCETVLTCRSTDMYTICFGKGFEFYSLWFGAFGYLIKGTTTFLIS